MKSLTFRLPETLYKEIYIISQAHNVPVSELIRNGMQIIGGRHYEEALAKLKGIRPDIDKVLKEQ